MDPGHIIFLLPWRPAKQNVRDAGGFSSQYMAKSKAIFLSISSCLVSLMRSKSLLAGNNNFVRLYDYFVACVQVFLIRRPAKRPSWFLLSDELSSRNHDSDKEKSEIDSDIGV